MNLWIASMECAGIVEAGGVKNVTLALCKEFSKLKHNVTLFIPIFKCNSWDLITDYQENIINEVPLYLCGKTEYVNFCKAKCSDGNFNIIFVNHPCFSQKEAIYTYTQNEQNQNPEFIKGHGHKDSLFMNTIFAKAVCEYGKFVASSDLPSIIHCQDASTATIPAFIKQNPIYSSTKSVVTIHNAGPAYHHNFSSIGEAAWYTNLPTDLLSGSLNNYKVEPFLIASSCGAYLSTVSVEYANELKNPKYFEQTEGLSQIFYNRNIQIKGITNGIEFDRYNPQKKECSHLPFEYSPQEGILDGKYKCREHFINELLQNKSFEGITTYGKIDSDFHSDGIFISYHGRITSQKGIELLINAIPVILENFSNVKFFIAGQGEVSLENKLIELCSLYPNQVLFFNGYNKYVARIVNAVCDFIVLPSYFEPCGLEDFISQIYGTIPIAHATGGLNKIVDNKSGFLYKTNSKEHLIAKLSEVITLKICKPNEIIKMIKFASKYVQENYDWSSVIKNEYLTFFEEILKKI